MIIRKFKNNFSSGIGIMFKKYSFIIQINYHTKENKMLITNMLKRNKSFTNSFKENFTKKDIIKI